MKRLLCLILVVVAASCCTAQIRTSPHQWSATLTVVDETGQPVPGAAVWVAFSIASPEGTPLHQRITGLTDTNGIFAASHTDPSVQLAFHAEKPGYYPISLQHYLGFSVEKKDVNWSPTPTLVLKRVLDPIPMYAKHLLQGPPVANKSIGYDLMAGDWIPPFGNGQSTDIIFTRHLDRKAKHDYDDKLEVSFPNAGDGIQAFAVPDDQRDSGLRSPHEAPADGYQTPLVRETSEHPGQQLKFDYNATRNYFFRVRTVLDEKGNVKSALYGKIYGDFMQFSYYLNPTPNDRNVEFDPNRNLLKGLKGSQIVDAP